MPNRLKSLYQNICFKKEMFFFIGGMLANFFYYFYRILMGRMLGPELFGELVAIISLVLILIVPSTSVQIAVARFSAIFQVKEKLAKIKGIFRYLTQAIGLITLGLIILTCIFAKPIQGFLKLSSISHIYFLVGIVVVMSLWGITKGILQGLRRFSQLTISILAESAGRVLFALALVVSGFKISGALAGILISLVLSYFLTIYFLRDIRAARSKGQEIGAERQEIKEIWKCLFYSFLAFVFLGILLNLDKILVKHYFQSFEAGIYSAFSTLGQGISITISLLAALMFPIVVSKQIKKENCFYSLKIASLLSFLIIGSASLVFFLLSEKLIWLFFGSDYLAGSYLLGYYGIVMGILGFVFLLSYFLIALNKFKFLYILAGASILEILLISIWHNSFCQVISMFLLSLIFALSGLGFLIFKGQQSLGKTKEL